MKQDHVKNSIPEDGSVFTRIQTSIQTVLENSVEATDLENIVNKIERIVSIRQTVNEEDDRVDPMSEENQTSSFGKIENEDEDFETNIKGMKVKSLSNAECAADKMLTSNIKEDGPSLLIKETSKEDFGGKKDIAYKDIDNKNIDTQSAINRPIQSVEMSPGQLAADDNKTHNTDSVNQPGVITLNADTGAQPVGGDTQGTRVDLGEDGEPINVDTGAQPVGVDTHGTRVDLGEDGEPIQVDYHSGSDTDLEDSSKTSTL